MKITSSVHKGWKAHKGCQKTFSFSSYLVHKGYLARKGFLPSPS
jgi:hypothetical protein